MKKKILITGGAGFIGSALVKKLLNEGHQCRLLDDFSRGHHRRLKEIENDIESVDGDIRDQDAVIQASKGMDSVFHLAFINGTEFFYKKPQDVLDVGVQGMVNVIKACEKQKVSELVLASSSEVYQSPGVIPTPEDVPLIVPDAYNPRYSYGGGKIISELMAIHMASVFMDRVMIFRPHNVYGPDMGFEHVIPQFALRILSLMEEHSEPLPFTIQGSGQETRAFIYIDDFVDGVNLIAERGQHLNTYHIGTQDEIPISKLSELTAEAFNTKIKLIHEDIPAGGTMRRCPDISKMKALGFQPNTSMQSGLKTTLDWYKNNRHLSPKQ